MSNTPSSLLVSYFYFFSNANRHLGHRQQQGEHRAGDRLKPKPPPDSDHGNHHDNDHGISNDEGMPALRTKVPLVEGESLTNVVSPVAYALARRRGGGGEFEGSLHITTFRIILQRTGPGKVRSGSMCFRFYLVSAVNAHICGVCFKRFCRVFQAFLVCVSSVFDPFFYWALLTRCCARIGAFFNA